MATIEEMQDALVNAHKAGDTQAARILADAIVAAQGQPPKKVTSFGSIDEQRERWAANHPIASKAAKLLQGIPFVGEYADEFLGGISGNPEGTNLIRAMQNREDKVNPWTSTALEFTGGVLPALPFGGPALNALGKVPTMAGKVVTGALSGGTLGGVEGFVSGYGSGTDDESRMENAKLRGAVGTGLGTVIGGAAPLVSAGAKNLYNTVLDRFTVNNRAKDFGLSRPSYDMLARQMDADGSLSGGGRANILAAGDDAMLADAGPNAAKLLDAAGARSGRSANIVNEAVEGRAAQARQGLVNAMDNVLGPTPDFKAKPKKPNLDPAYRAAYSKPIDYADPKAMEIEEILNTRIPKRLMGRVIGEAEDLMQMDGHKSAQIMAKVANDGSVTFERMPDVRQLDYITRALNTLAESTDGQGVMGGLTSKGRAYKKLAREIRTRLSDLVPEYKTALEGASNFIGEKEAREFGEEMLRPGVTRSAAAEMIRDMGNAEKAELKKGIRMYIDDQMALVRRALSDANMDAREAAKGISELSSRGSRDKIRLILPDVEANKLLAEIDKAGRAISLRASVAQNSKTFVRQELDQSIKALTDDGIVNAARGGRALEAPRRLAAAFMGRTEADKQRIADATYEEIATVLTKFRGKTALRALRVLEDIARKSPQNEAVARALADYSTAAVAIPAYQTGMQYTRGPQ